MNLHKPHPSERVKALKPGDPWTFVGLTPEQMANAIELGVGGVTSRWFDTSEPGREFRTTAIHPAINAVETVFIGFQIFEAVEP